MKSLYGVILLWFVLLLAVAGALMLFASPVFLFRLSGKGGPVERMNMVFLGQARQALARGGGAELGAYLRGLEAQLPARYFLLDDAGRDLATGEDRSLLLRLASRGIWVPRKNGLLMRTYGKDGFHLLLLIRPEAPEEGRAPYALLLFLVTSALCWVFAARLAAPVRSLARTMEQFGRGDLQVRSTIQRADEIGDLARSFNRMAERIGSLLAAERRLLQEISHELQSPLARMAVAAKLTRTAPDRESAAARVQKEVDRMSQLVSALLDLARAEGDPESRRRERVPLADLLRDLIEDCQPEASEHGCTLRAELAEALVDGDEELLRRAFENVLRNALRHAPAGSSVEVYLRTAGGEAEVVVRDYGPGVPPESLGKIFTPFYRVTGTGTGLGLSLARRAVMLHQGRIGAENADPGLRVSIQLHTS
ncbi:MAG: HAMP domain-containing histidine kinase [Bryobacterales bacterium]|nr:HAMP domain-containing histidine kinase [Bryobacterales bacterium]